MFPSIKKESAPRWGWLARCREVGDKKALSGEFARPGPNVNTCKIKKLNVKMKKSKKVEIDNSVIVW